MDGYMKYNSDLMAVGHKQEYVQGTEFVVFFCQL